MAFSRSNSNSSSIDLTVESRSSATSYGDSWRLAAETNNVGGWKVVPSKCVSSLETYYKGGQFDNDYSLVASYALGFAKTVKIGEEGMDAWIFDVDDTLLSNFEYTNAHGYGSMPLDIDSYQEWVEQGTCPRFDASFRLYEGLKTLGFTIILITGRYESQRSITEENLRDAGYSGWERLILKGHEDEGKTATQYKSEQRAKLVEEGFKLHGNIGDQWSDLHGFALAERSFKVPNPIYYIP